MTAIGQVYEWLSFYAYSLSPGVFAPTYSVWLAVSSGLAVMLAILVPGISRWFCGYLGRELGGLPWPAPCGHWRYAYQCFLCWYLVSATALHALASLPEDQRWVWLLWLALLGLLALIDAQTAILPNELTLLLLLAGLLWRGPIQADGLPPPDYVWGVLLGWALPMGVNAWHQWRHASLAIGQGDAKLLAAVGAWLGLTSLPVVWLVACAGVLVYTAGLWVMTRQWHTSVTFGPFLALGASAAMFLSYV